MAEKKDELTQEQQLKSIMDSMKNLTTVVGTLATGLESTQKNVTDLTSNVSNLSNMSKEQLEQLKQQQQQTAEDSDMAGELDANDLEGMNRQDFMGHILGQVNKGFEKLTEQISGQVSSVNDSVNTSAIKIEYKEAKEQFPDFDHYKDEIAAVAQANPDMKIKDMYTLAKANNPNKVTEVTKTLDDQKVKDDEKAAEVAAADKTKTKGYGGLTPTSGQRHEKPSDMTQENASNAAWDETMAEIELEQG